MDFVSEPTSPIPRERLLRLPQVEELTGLKKSTLYRLMKEGRFVRCVQVTPRCTAWPESHVLQWVQERIRHAEATATGALL